MSSDASTSERSTRLTCSFGDFAAASVITQKKNFEKMGQVFRQSDLAASINALLATWIDNNGPMPAQPMLKTIEGATITPPLVLESTSEQENHAKGKSSRGSNIPPTAEEVTEYSASIGYPLNGQAWCDAYAAKGWLVGKTRMKDWKAAVRNWKTQGYGEKGIALAPITAAASTIKKDYSKF